MAKYHVKHQCGCTVTHHLIGKVDARESRIGWLKTTDCLECQNAAAVDANGSLPALSGSPKQISWAETLRATRLEEMTAMAARVQDTADSDIKTQVINAIERISNVTSSKYWIDRRKWTVSDTLKEIANG